MFEPRISWFVISLENKISTRPCAMIVHQYADGNRVIA